MTYLKGGSRFVAVCNRGRVKNSQYRSDVLYERPPSRNVHIQKYALTSVAWIGADLTVLFKKLRKIFEGPLSMRRN